MSKGGWLWLCLVGIAGCEGPDAVPVADGSWARGDTGDSGLLLEPQCADPGFCGCDFTGLDLDESGSVETCIHDTAIIDGEVQLGARVEAGAEVRANAVLGAGATLGVNSILAERSVVGANAVLGDGVIVGRRATVGVGAQVGDGSTLGRSASVGANVDASIGRLTLGYGAGIGAGTDITGLDVVFGNLASVGINSTIAGEVILARGATFGDNTVLGEGVIIGPEVVALDGANIGTGTRIRKGVTLGDSVTVGNGVRIGRDSELRDNSRVGANATLRALVTVGLNAQVDDTAFIPRGTIIPDVVGGPGGDPFDADAPPRILITSPNDGADTASGTLTLTGTVVEDVALSLVQVRVNGGGWQPMTVSGGTFTHTLTGIPDMAHTIEVRAIDSAGQMSRDWLYVRDSAPSMSFTHTWTGAVSTDWSTAGNWDAGTVPGSFSVVRIPQTTARQPVLSSSVTVSQAWLDAQAVITTGSHTLGLNARLAGGTVTGAGGVVLNNGAYGTGRVSNLAIVGSPYVEGLLDVMGDFHIQQGSHRLSINDGTLRVRGDFSQDVNEQTRGLSMGHADATVIIDGNATFTGPVVQNVNTVNVGRFRIGGDLLIDCDTCVRATSTFEFDGTAPQTVHMTNGSNTTSYLGPIVVRNRTGVSFTVDTGAIYSTGTLSVLDGGVMSTEEARFAATSGTNRFTGNASFTNTGTALFGSDIAVEDSSALDVDVLDAARELIVSGDGRVAGNTVAMRSRLPVTGDHYTVADTQIIGWTTISADQSLTMPKLSIPQGGGRLTIQDATVSVSGDFAQDLFSPTGGVIMSHANARLEIGGSADFTGTTYMNTNSMNTGSMTVGGDMSVTCDGVDNCFYLSGMELTFDGTSPQAVSIDYTTGNRLPSVTVTNPAGVTMTSLDGVIQANGILNLLGGSLDTESITFNGTAGTSLINGGGALTGPGTVTLKVPVTLADGASIDIGALSSTGLIDVQAGTSLNAGYVDIYNALPITAGSYTAATTRIFGIGIVVNSDTTLTLPKLEIPVGSGRLEIGDATLTITGDFAQDILQGTRGVNFTHTNAHLDVGGDVTLGAQESHNGNYYNMGTLSMGGDLTVDCAVGITCVTSAGTSFVFDGSGNQNVTLPASNQYLIKSFEVAPGSQLTLQTDAVLYTDAIVRGTWVVPAGRTARAGRDLLLEGGVIQNSGTFEYNRTFTNNAGTVVGTMPVAY